MADRMQSAVDRKQSAVKYLRMARPFLMLGAEELASLDEDDVGADDRAAAALSYAADVVDAIVRKKDIPYPPDSLMKATASPRW